MKKPCKTCGHSTKDHIVNSFTVTNCHHEDNVKCSYCDSKGTVIEQIPDSILGDYRLDEKGEKFDYNRKHPMILKLISITVERICPKCKGETIRCECECYIDVKTGYKMHKVGSRKNEKGQTKPFDANWKLPNNA